MCRPEPVLRWNRSIKIVRYNLHQSRQLLHNSFNFRIFNSCICNWSFKTASFTIWACNKESIHLFNKHSLFRTLANVIWSIVAWLISTLVIMFPIRTAGMVWFNLDDSLPSSDKAVALTASRAVSMFSLLWYEFLAFLWHFDNSLDSWIIWLATLSRAIPRLSSSSLVATILINLDALPRNKTKEATPTPERTNRSGPKFWESFL